MSNTATIEILERPVSQSIESVVAQLDIATQDMKGPRPSQAWAYRETVRAKYGLPECGYFEDNPVRYIYTIEEYLRQRGVRIRDKSEFQPFFAQFPKAEAAYFGLDIYYMEPTVVVQTAGDYNWKRLQDRAYQLAHEAVHATQAQLFPSIPLRDMEREAYYYSILTPDFILMFQRVPKIIMSVLNNTIERNVAGSVSVDQLLTNRV